jgi:hypothetical protein
LFIDEFDVPFKPFGVLNKRSLRVNIRLEANERELFDNERSSNLNGSL